MTDTPRIETVKCHACGQDRPVKHGLATTYRKLGCRCSECREAVRIDTKRYRAQQPRGQKTRYPTGELSKIKRGMK